VWSAVGLVAEERNIVMKRLIGAVLVLAVGSLFTAAAALADTTDIIEPQSTPFPTKQDGWQAGTCKEELPEPGAEVCSPETPSQFYRQAAGHPPYGFTQYIIQHDETTGKVEPAGITIPTSPIKEPEADREIKTLRVDLPPGLTVNPNAAPRCSLEEFEHTVGGFHVPLCANGSIVGIEKVTLVTTAGGIVPAPSPPFPSGQTLPKGTVVPPTPGLSEVPVYNLQPKAGEPALFGFVVASQQVVFLETDVSWQNDFHEAFTIHLPPASPPFATLKSRLVNFGVEAGNLELNAEKEIVKNTTNPVGNGTFITMPTTCFDPAEWPHLYSTWFRAESYGEPNPTFPIGSTPVESKVEDSAGSLIQLEGCEAVPFEPGVDVSPGTNQVDSPSGATVNTTLKYYTAEESEIEASHLRRIEETLPEGMGINPSGANGLAACTDAQFKKGVRTYTNECPASSKVGTVEIESPPLSAPLKGDVYVGEQKSSIPASGEMFRILLEAKNEGLGIDVRLVGKVKANPESGQLTTVVDEQEQGELAGQLPEGLPQAPFTSVKLHFDGAKATLTTPPTCADAETTGTMEPWARPGTSEHASSKFTLSSIPGGGTCPTTLGGRPFAPKYEAKTSNTKGGSYTNFRVHIGRSDGQQELKGIDVTLPEGLTGNLSGIPYCSDAAIAAAAANSGAAEKAHPSCPSDSRVGSAETQSGTGSHPITIGGDAYLAGPYKGAPLSLVVITPATAGPFDLGTVVVRVALFVDPITTQVRSVADVLPHVFGGVRLDIRSITVNLDRKKFMLNPTNCEPKQVAGTLSGGGSDPTNPSAFSSYAVSEPFQATNCKRLKFRPKLFTRLFGSHKSTHRTGHPKFRAILEARKGDANIARSAVILSNSVILDQSHIRTVCTRVQLAAHQCPKAAIYGNAKAMSPLLDGQLKGPVYMVSSEHKLPDLVADLRGQVNIQLHGVISTKRGGIKTVFFPVPDVPVKKFILTMKGGNRGLLVNSKNLCRSHPHSFVNLKAQNGKKVIYKRLKLKVPKCPKRAGHAHHGSGSHRLG
jgi:hypothetical protein